MIWWIWYIFTRALESLKIGTFMASFKLKCISVKCTEELKWWKTWKAIDLLFQNCYEKFDGFRQILTQSLKNVKKFLSNRLLSCKVYIAWTKKYRGFIFYDTEDWWTICRRIGRSLQYWYEEFDRFWPEHSKVTKIFTLMHSFWAKYIEGLCLIALKINARCEGKLSCTFNNDMRTLANFCKLKNSSFILKSKVVELNQNQNSKQADRPHAVWKLYFTFAINTRG